MKKLLIPVDANSISEPFKLFLKDLVAGMDYEVTLFYVVPIERNLVHGDMMSFRDDNKAIFEEIAAKILSDAEVELKALGIERIQKEHAQGDPTDEILKFSEQGGFHSIAMSSHGMSAAKRFLIGSVTNKVVHHSKIPVIVMK